jgi:hypothetical protein
MSRIHFHRPNELMDALTGRGHTTRTHSGHLPRSSRIAATSLAMIVALSTCFTAKSMAIELEFYTGDYAYGEARLDNNLRSGSASLTRFNSRDLATVTAPSNSLSLAKSYSNIVFQNSGPSCRIQFKTSADPQSKYSYGQARMYTTFNSTNNGHQYIYFRLRPTRTSEYRGKPARVTINARADSSIYSPDNRAFTFSQVHTGTGVLLSSRDFRTQYGRSKSTSFNTRIGEWIPVAMFAQSYGTPKSSAWHQLTVDISAR